MSGENELDSIFFLTFIGQAVTITTTVLHSMRYPLSDEQHIESMPLYYEGILLDEDQEYYYLGNTPDEVSQAVKKVHVLHITVIEQKTVFDHILEHTPLPTDDSEFN